MNYRSVVAILICWILLSTTYATVLCLTEETQLQWKWRPLCTHIRSIMLYALMMLWMHNIVQWNRCIMHPVYRCIMHAVYRCIMHPVYRCIMHAVYMHEEIILYDFFTRLILNWSVACHRVQSYCVFVWYSVDIQNVSFIHRLEILLLPQSTYNVCSLLWNNYVLDFKIFQIFACMRIFKLVFWMYERGFWSLV